MSEIRVLPEQEKRVESGAIQFGDDWPGTFLRGDCSFYYASALQSVLDGTDDVFAPIILRGLLDTLRCCDLTRAADDKFTLTNLGRAYVAALKGGE